MKTEKQGEKTEQQHKHGERDRERGLRADQEKRPVFAEDAVRKVANGRREGVGGRKSHLMVVYNRALLSMEPILILFLFF